MEQIARVAGDLPRHTSVSATLPDASVSFEKVLSTKKKGLIGLVVYYLFYFSNVEECLR